MAKLTIEELDRLQFGKVLHQRPQPQKTLDDAKPFWRKGRECPNCKGHGRIGVMACFECGATGRILGEGMTNRPVKYRFANMSMHPGGEMGKRRETVTIYVPDGYKDAKEFLKDCQFERAPPQHS
jgi:hypothetical protein